MADFGDRPIRWVVQDPLLAAKSGAPRRVGACSSLSIGLRLAEIKEGRGRSPAAAQLPDMSSSMPDSASACSGSTLSVREKISVTSSPLS